ncbi:LamG-like jellyroll fold domain-containing protein [Spongiivirga sp. MCCC 1A20706]|uniref:LamG-like jellyroll fold domain-containing protein n=1 Tax=Spongiivirga sp. MCCC 1A20706 TaxID=3160963 RepID=UPI00397762B8
MRLTTNSFLIVFMCLILSNCKNEKKKTTSDSVTSNAAGKHQDLKDNLSLYASFDNGVDADFAKGDASMYSVTNRKERDSAKLGLDKEGVSIVNQEGYVGDALKFTKRSKGYIYFKSKGNVSYSTANWEGTISFWLSLDPETDLEPGYCDPIQITDSGYNDAGFWVDFTKENPRDFRLGVIGDRISWNPNPEGPDNENPIFIEQLPVVKNPPFDTGKWTHVVITFKDLNTENGQAALYLDGALKGERKEIKDPFTWEVDQSNIYLGLGYIGLMDEISIFEKSLSSEQVGALYTLKGGVKTLLD